MVDQGKNFKKSISLKNKEWIYTNGSVDQVGERVSEREKGIDLRVR